MLAQVIESAQTSKLRSIYIGFILALFTMMVVSTAVKHSGIVGKPVISDFDAFYLASKLALRGDIIQSYDFPTYVKQQIELLGKNYRLTWSYPPPYDLVVAPLALLSRGWSFGAFFALTLGAYLWGVRRLAGAGLVTLLVLLAVPVCAVVFFGQNGLLTGALVALAVIGLRDRRAWAGVPLGLMIIKPHLAVALAVYVIINGRWQVVAVAAVTVLVASLLPMLLIGPDIWTAFLAGIRNTASFLQGRFYPFCRMVSAYSALRSAGLSNEVALAGQAAVGVTTLAAIVVAQRRLAMPVALGFAAFASLMISPYAYDYDVPVMGVGLALLLPVLATRARPWERSLIYALFLFIAGYGAFHTVYYGPSQVGRSAAGLAQAVLVGLVFVAISRRDEVKHA